MKYSIKNYLSFILIISGCTSFISLNAQVDGTSLSKLTPKKVPVAYLFPKGGIESASTTRLEQASGAYNANYWIVYSDRDDNQTFKDKNLQTPLSRVNFSETFIVAEETDKAIRLVECCDPWPIDDSKSKHAFNAVAKDAGWISKSKVLLWSNCLVDSVNNYAKKAVAVKKLSKESDLVTLIKRGVLDFYSAPVAEKNFENDKDVKLFQYLFIFKEENNMCLLGNVNVVKANTFHLDIYGWVSKAQIQEWTSAICLRINFDEVAVEEREKQKLKPKFFRTAQQANDYKDGKDVPSMVFNYTDPTENDKDNPFLLGYPIISQPDPKIPVFKTGYVTNIVDGGGRNVFSAMTGAGIDQEGNAIINNKRKIDIVFVLDGNERAMYKTLAKALDNNASIGNAQLSKNKYRLGAVIYNDKKCDEPFTKHSWKASKDNFTSLLDDESIKKLPCIDRSAGAPLSEALKIACDFFDNDKNSNVIVVLGNVSDNDALKKEDALKALIAKNVKMFYYQTSNKDGKHYDNYYRNCKYFLEQVSNNKDQDFTASIAKNLRKRAELLCEGESCKLINTAIPGWYQAKDDGKTFTPIELGGSLRNLLDKIENEINETISMFEQQKGTVKTIAENEDQIKEFQSWLKDEGFSQATIDKLSTMNNFQLFVEGYTALKPKSAVNPIFERTLFVADKEFGKMLDDLEKLTTCYSPGERRECVVSVCRNIILAYRGQMDDSQIEKFTIEDVYKLITKLPTTNPLFKKSLKDIKNPKITTEPEIEKLKNSLSLVHQRIKQVKKNVNYRFEQDEQLFYWVPESKLNIEE